LATPPRPPSQPQGRPSSPEGDPRSDSATHAAWQWAGDECQLIRALLRALHGFCVQHIPHGWTALEQTACHLRYKIPSLGMTSAPHVMLHSAAICAATRLKSQAMGPCPNGYLTSSTIQCCGKCDECLGHQSQALVMFGGVSEYCTTANLTAALVSELLTVVLLTCGQHVSIQQHHTLAQVANAHRHSHQIHSPGMCPPDASGICRLYAARGVVDGHGLLHELMADVIEDVSGQGSAGGAVAADSWLTVSSVTSEVCRDNAVGMLSCTSFGPTPSCMQRTKLQQDCVATLHYNHVACGKCSTLQRCSASAPSSSTECICSAAQYLSQLVASSLLPVFPCNRSLACQAGLLLRHQNSKVDKTDGN